MKKADKDDLVGRFTIATGASAEDAYCYLEAEEWNLEDAVRSWLTDGYLRTA